VRQEKQSEQPKKKTRGSFLLTLAVLGLTLVVLLSVVDRQMQIADKREQLETLQTQLDAQNQKNQELRRALEEENGLADYAERRARLDLGYAKPGEKVFIDMGGE
jgi:cell division protein FtsB